jgi:hypothetical protein
VPPSLLDTEDTEQRAPSVDSTVQGIGIRKDKIFVWNELTKIALIDKEREWGFSGVLPLRPFPLEKALQAADVIARRDCFAPVPCLRQGKGGECS